MSIILYYIVLALEILTGLWRLYRTAKYGKHINKKSNAIKINNCKSNILIVIPCLREQDIIIKTLQHFLKITDNFNNVKILVVTTQKEEYEKEKNLYLKGQMIKDIKNNVDIQRLINSYNKILSTDEIRKILKHKDNESVEQLVNNTIDMSKTTGQIVSEFIVKTI